MLIGEDLYFGALFEVFSLFLLFIQSLLKYSSSSSEIERVKAQCCRYSGRDRRANYEKLFFHFLAKQE